MGSGIAFVTEDGSMPDSLLIGRRIRQFRSDRGLTLDDLAAELGRAPSQVSVIENGKRDSCLSLVYVGANQCLGPVEK